MCIEQKMPQGNYDSGGVECLQQKRVGAYKDLIELTKGWKPVAEPRNIYTSDK